MRLELKNQVQPVTIYPRDMKHRQLGIVRAGHSEYIGQLVIKIEDSLHSLGEKVGTWSSCGMLTLQIEVVPPGTELVWR
jgi:hypothetical protein